MVGVSMMSLIVFVLAGILLIGGVIFLVAQILDKKDRDKR